MCGRSHFIYLTIGDLFRLLDIELEDVEAPEEGEDESTTDDEDQAGSRNFSFSTLDTTPR